jgi:outer membrane receptor protein involved in Fe transport
VRRAEEQKGQIDYAPVVNLQGGPTVVTYDSRIRGNDTWESTTPRVTVNYKAADDLTLYANYAKGYKPGGFNGSIAIINGRPQDESFDQEESVNYEVGMKSTWMDNRLVFNVAVFKMDVTAIQLTTPIQASTGAVTSISTNQGDGQVKGFEVETKYAATEELTLGFNYALADTEFTKGCDDMQFTITSGGGIFNPNDPNSTARNLNGQGSCSIAGNEFPLAAKHTASLTADFVRPVFGGDYEFYLNSDLSYTSKKWVQVHNLAYTGAAALLGARFGIQTNDWKVGVYGRNLTNEDSSPGATRWLQQNLIGVNGLTVPATPATSVASYSLPRGFFGVLRRERQIGLEFSYNF